MKKIIVGLIFCIGLFSTGHAQSNEITFVPGLGETGSVWSGMTDNLHQDSYSFYNNSINYNGYNSISSSAGNAYIPNGDVVITHSEGGLLARKYLQESSSHSYKALITVGAPNAGAPIVNPVLNGTASNVIAGMINKLLLGPNVALHVFLPSPVGASVVSAVENLLATGQQSLQAYLNYLYQDQPGINDMKPGSSFLSTLNQYPGNTLPAAHYAIYGAEGIHTPWHLAGSAYAGTGQVENSLGITVHDKLESIYLDVTISAAGIADLYRLRRDRAKRNYNFDDYFKYNRLYHKWQDVAAAFNVGYRSLLIGDQKEWSTYVTKSLIPQEFASGAFIVPKKWYAEDGLLSSETQAPKFFSKDDGINRRLQALGANHLEETAHPKVKQRLEEIFQNGDVNIPKNQTGDGGGSGGDGGGITPPPPPCNAGGTPIAC